MSSKTGTCTIIYRIGDVMVSILSWCAGDRELKPCTFKPDYKSCFWDISAAHAVFRSKTKDWFSVNKDNISEYGVPCLSADCCFSERPLLKSK